MDPKPATLNIVKKRFGLRVLICMHFRKCWVWLRYHAALTRKAGMRGKLPSDGPAS